MSRRPAEHTPGMPPDDGPESLGEIIPRVLRMRGINVCATAASPHAGQVAPLIAREDRMGLREVCEWNEPPATSRVSVRRLTPVA